MSIREVTYLMHINRINAVSNKARDTAIPTYVTKRIAKAACSGYCNKMNKAIQCAKQSLFSPSISAGSADIRKSSTRIYTLSTSLRLKFVYKPGDLSGRRLTPVSIARGGWEYRYSTGWHASPSQVSPRSLLSTTLIMDTCSNLKIKCFDFEKKFKISLTRY